MKLWTSGGAREFEIETPNLVWLVLTLSSIGVPHLITLPQTVLWAAIDFREKISKKTESKKKKIIIGIWAKNLTDFGKH